MSCVRCRSGGCSLLFSMPLICAVLPGLAPSPAWTREHRILVCQNFNSTLQQQSRSKAKGSSKSCFVSSWGNSETVQVGFFCCCGFLPFCLEGILLLLVWVDMIFQPGKGGPVFWSFCWPMVVLWLAFFMMQRNMCRAHLPDAGKVLTETQKPCKHWLSWREREHCIK